MSPHLVHSLFTAGLYKISFCQVVHVITFSAGVGRTGTYITLDNVLDQIETEGLVDIDGVIVKIRNQRMKMVQTKVNN